MGDERHGGGHHHHHHDHDHCDHHHHDGARPGPEGTAFLDLEISKVLLGESGAIVKQAAMDLVREAARERLRERLGDRLAAVGRLAADELADDLEANLEIEQRISARKEKAGSLEERLREALASPGGPERAAPAGRSTSASTRKKSGRGKRPVRG